MQLIYENELKHKLLKWNSVYQIVTKQISTFQDNRL